MYYLQASQPFGHHPYCSMWWRRNLYSDQREGPSLTWGPRWHRQTQRAAPARLHTNPLGFFQQTPDGGERCGRICKSNKQHKVYDCWMMHFLPKDQSLKNRDKNLLYTSVPIPGCVPLNTSSGGGPPYFLCPVVTSRVYPVRSNRAWKTQKKTKRLPELHGCRGMFDQNHTILFTFIFVSSGPLLESCTLLPCFSLCL